MKYLTKKLISTLLFITILMLPISVFSVGEKPMFKDIEGDEIYAISVSALAKLNILKGYPDTTFGAENDITRAEVVAVNLRFLGKEKSAQKAKGETVYDDVNAGHWASGYINLATELKIIEGDGLGHFFPENNVNYEEAVKMLVVAAGYGDEGIEAGGYPDGYIKFAFSKKILDGVTAKKGEIINRGTIAQLTYQTIISQLNIIESSLDEGEYASSQKTTLTCLSKNAKIYYTLDGTMPTEKSAAYKNAITIKETSTLKAIAILKGIIKGNKVLSKTYSIKTTTLADKNTPLGGAFTNQGSSAGRSGNAGGSNGGGGGNQPPGGNGGENVPPLVSVTGVSISPEYAEITIGETTYLNAAVFPSNASNKNVIWSSDYKEIAIVNDAGAVTGISEGIAIITVTTQDGNYNAKCEITVIPNEADVSVIFGHSPTGDRTLTVTVDGQSVSGTLDIEGFTMKVTDGRAAAPGAATEVAPGKSYTLITGNNIYTGIIIQD